MNSLSLISVWICSLLLVTYTSTIFAKGQGAFSSAQIISTNAPGGTSVFGADLNGDSHIDVLVAYSGTIVW